MSIRDDFWRTFRVLESLGISGWEKAPNVENAHHGGDIQTLLSLMSCRFELALARSGLVVDTASLLWARTSWEYFLVNLHLYSKYSVTYIRNAASEMSQLCAQLRVTPADIFRNDWTCMYEKNSLFKRLGEAQYYAHPVYLSHLWVENVAARRLFFVHHIHVLMKAAGIVPSHCRVLDVGSGIAGCLRLFPDVQERIGIDCSKPMVKWCNDTRSEGETYEVMDCRAIEYSDATFHVVLCFDVLEHIDQPRRALREMCRVVKPKGVVAIVYPFGSHGWDSHISLVEKSVFDGWLADTGYGIVGELMAPGEVFPTSVCYLLRPE